MMTGDSSDSDDGHELPEKEPEFIIHIVDDHNPPAPPRPMYRRPLAAALPYGLPPVAQLDGGDDDGPTECTCCLFIKFVHFGLVMSMVFTTAFLAADLPKEYRTGGDRVLILVGPIIIGVVAVSWLVHAFFDKERR